MKLPSAVAIFAACAVCAPALAQDATKQLAARVELHPIPSLTLSDEQFLKGERGGKSVVVTGELRLAQGAARTPVVIPHVGHDPAATRSARQSVKDFLKTVFQLAPPA